MTLLKFVEHNLFKNFIIALIVLNGITMGISTSKDLMITYGVFYYLVPRLAGRELYSLRLANIHFWLALSGTILYILAMWAAGVSQGLLWMSIDELGQLNYTFNDIMASMKPYYGLRLIAGLVFLSGTILMSFNLFMTIKGKKTVKVKPPTIVKASEVAA